MMTAQPDSRSPGSPETIETGPAALLADRYSRVRAASLALIDTLEPEDCVVQTMPEVSPTKWHLAHVSWFFEQFCLGHFAADYQPFDQRYAFLFNSYYQTVGAMHSRPHRGLLSRPLLRDVLEFRRYVDDAMLALIEQRAGDSEFEFVVALGLNHEQQHQELLLTDIKHVLFSSPIGAAYRGADRHVAAENTAHAFLSFTGGERRIGFAGDGFSFDNETPRHAVLLRDYALGDRLVTNGDYREFIDAGGYREPELWLADGWATVQREAWSRPLYWSEDGAREFSLNGWQPADSAAPVSHVSFYEADAFARWAGARLPTEAEWECAVAAIPISGNTLDSDALRPLPAGPRDEGQLKPAQVWGDAWEWTASPYQAYPGFRPLAGSLGEYNGKFMVNQMVVRGGSCATWADHLRATYRSFFYPQDRWQFLGIRLAKDI
jgi:ergothioneine biosynthesis protein EgtB